MRTTPAFISLALSFVCFLLAGLGVTVKVSATTTLSLRDLGFAFVVLAWLLA